MIDRDTLLAVMAEHGFDNTGENPHRWRCSHPDRYPNYCSCPQDLADAIIALLQADRPQMLIHAANAEQKLDEIATLFDDYHWWGTSEHKLRRRVQEIIKRKDTP